jgi:predicted dehydrogenase
LSATRRIDVGVIGVGEIGTVHAEALACRVPGARLAAVADADEQAASAGAARYGCTACDVDEMLAIEAIDAVVIATPPATHLDLVQRGARAGKHVLCEKPLAYTTAEAREAVDACRAAEVTLQVGFVRRFDPDFGACARAIRSGRIGPVKLFFDSHRDRAPAPHLRYRERLVSEALCHDLDAARWMVGEIDQVTAHAPANQPPDGPDDVLIVVRFENGAVGTIDGSREVGYGFECRTEVVGESGTFRVGTSASHNRQLPTPSVAS